MTQPPIVPGDWTPQPVEPPSEAVPAPPSPRRRRGWLTPVLVAGLAVLTLGGAAAVYGLLTALNHDRPLRTAYTSCGSVGEISDGDRTLYLNMKGNDAGSGNLDVDDLFCVLRALKTPSYVVHEMDGTRAMDGRQSETWDQFEASWSYHPDNGLDVLIREK